MINEHLYEKHEPDGLEDTKDLIGSRSLSSSLFMVSGCVSS